MSGGKDASLVGDDGVYVASKAGAGAVEVAGPGVPDLGDELGIDDSFDVWLPDIPYALIEDSQIDEGELMGEEVKVFTDSCRCFNIALSVIIQTQICLEATEVDEGRMALSEVEEDLGVE
ncbi:MAG: hypothetical protein ACWA5W_07250 [Phycisphaerales bacterium]